MEETDFQRAVSEDTLNCLYFSTQEVSWDELRVNINKTIHELSAGYLWHKDKFEVFPPILNKKADDVPVHLFSSTCFGDNIEDEWFMVYLIYEITKKYKHLVVHMSDNDGDFILIEAADFLPKWMNPENTDKRVFIHNSEIHIVPDCMVKPDTELNFKDSINLIKIRSLETKAIDDIQQAIKKRVSGYPEKIKENIHKAVVELPPELATLLTLQPNLISPLVNAYCNHDVIDAKCCRNLKLGDTIFVNVVFTKCQYAQLTHSQIMKTASKLFAKQNDKRFLLGLKLTCGYKIIMNESLNTFDSKEYRKFIESLTNIGYFQGNLEGSKDYKSLLEKANEYFSLVLCPVNTSVCKSIDALKTTEEFQKQQYDLIQNSDRSLKDEENDNWMNINSRQLNDLLSSRYGEEVKMNEEITPHSITNQLSRFLNKTSDFEGIELDKRDTINDDQIEFNCDLFADALENMLNLISGKANEDDFSSDNDEEDIQTESLNEIQAHIDHELIESLSSDLIGQNATDSKAMFKNIVQSLKEEGSCGPSSNLLKSIGIHKSHLLDSDDDSE